MRSSTNGAEKYAIFSDKKSNMTFVPACFKGTLNKEQLSRRSSPVVVVLCPGVSQEQGLFATEKQNFPFAFEKYFTIPVLSVAFSVRSECCEPAELLESGVRRCARPFSECAVKSLQRTGPLGNWCATKHTLCDNRDLGAGYSQKNG